MKLHQWNLGVNEICFSLVIKVRWPYFQTPKLGHLCVWHAYALIKIWDNYLILAHRLTSPFNTTDSTSADEKFCRVSKNPPRYLSVCTRAHNIKITLAPIFTALCYKVLTSLQRLRGSFGNHCLCLIFWKNRFSLSHVS